MVPIPPCRSWGSAKLNVALSANVGDVSKLAMAIGEALKTATESLLGPSGPLASQTAGINRSITDIGTQRTRIQGRLESVQQRYQAQFNALDTLLSNMTKTSNFLTQQLANLPKTSS